MQYELVHELVHQYFDQDWDYLKWVVVVVVVLIDDLEIQQNIDHIHVLIEYEFLN